jgi:hypothetical protein
MASVSTHVGQARNYPRKGCINAAANPASRQYRPGGPAAGLLFRPVERPAGTWVVPVRIVRACGWIVLLGLLALSFGIDLGLVRISAKAGGFREVVQGLYVGDH